MSPFQKDVIQQPSEIYMSLKTSLKLFKAPFAELTNEQRNRVQSEVQKEHALQQKILKTPEVTHVHVDDLSLRQAINSIRTRYADNQSFESDLQKNGLNSISLSEALTNELKAELVLDHVADSAPQITDKEISDYYHANKEKFHTQEERFARHILITINPDFPENSPENSRKRLTSIRIQLDKDPTNFSILATQYSECTSALKEGELGRVGRRKLFPQLEEALFQLEKGEISEIVETKMGLHLVYCEQIWPAEEISLQEAHKTIHDALTKRQRLSHQKKWLLDLVLETTA